MSEVNIEFDEKLSKAIDETITSYPQRVTQALHKSVYEVETPARRSAQELFNHPTGNLPSSIHSEVNAREFYGRVGTNLVYARLREKGGVVHGAWGRATTHHVGRPYLVPAFESAKNKIVDVFRKMTDETLDDIAKKSK